MFKKTKCKKCGRKIGEKYSFCPYCGNKINLENEEDEFGILGRTDNIPSRTEIRLPLGFNTIFNSVLNSLSKEFDEELGKSFIKDEKSKTIKKDGISISISTFGDGPPRIKVKNLNLGNNEKTESKKAVKKIKDKNFTAEKIKQFTSLKREEPKANIRRMSNGVIYELEMPDVKSTEDISITQMENSIEIRAIGKSKSYAKRISINLPLKDYNFSEGKLILELGTKN